MMASWVIGKNVKLMEFCQKLKESPFDVVLLTLTNAMRSSSVIWKYLQALVVGGTGERRMPNRGVAVAVLEGKVVLCLKDSVWMVVNRAKVSSCDFAECCYRSCGKLCPLFFGALHLTKKTTGQRMEHITIGVICIQGKVYQHEARMLAQWIVENQIAILGGFWGHNTAKQFVKELAMEAGAVGNGPCSQQMLKLNNRSREWETVTHPSYFLFFGRYRQIAWHDPAGPGDFVMGRDVEDELIPIKNAPDWNLNQLGSAHVPELGNIKMKDPDFEKWCKGSFQTCVWMGTSTPSYKRQLLSLNRPGGRR